MEIYAANQAYYDKFYQPQTPAQVVKQVKNRARLLSGENVSPSWVNFTGDILRPRIQDAVVLELGAGTGLFSLIMAAEGAQRVIVIDITEQTRRLVNSAAATLGLSDQIEVHIGDFADMDFPAASIKFAVARGVLHHLPHDVEARYIAKLAHLLTPDGEVRCSEPPPFEVGPDHPEYGLHPERDDSTEHYRALGAQYFDEVQVLPIERAGIVQAQTIVYRKPHRT